MCVESHRKSSSNFAHRSCFYFGSNVPIYHLTIREIGLEVHVVYNAVPLGNPIYIGPNNAPLKTYGNYKTGLLHYCGQIVADELRGADGFNPADTYTGRPVIITRLTVCYKLGGPILMT